MFVIDSREVFKVTESNSSGFFLFISSRSLNLKSMIVRTKVQKKFVRFTERERKKERKKERTKEIIVDIIYS